MNIVTKFKEAWAWSRKEEELYRQLLRNYRPVLHVFSGRSTLGDVRIDCENFPEVTHRIRIVPSLDFKLPFRDNEFEAAIADPPWINQYMIWLSHELPRVASRRIIVITDRFWWEPHKKYRGKFTLTRIYVVKKISPVVKLVFVYDNKNQALT